MTLTVPPTYHYISFPGLGLKRDFHIDTTAVSIGDLEIKWYGLIIVCGMIAAVIYAYLHARRHGLIFDDVIDIALCSIIPGVLGARAYYVFFDWLASPEKYNSFYDVIAIWEGGLAIYGGLIFGVIGALIALKIKKIHIPTMLDCAFPGILLAQSIGRWGNFINMEAYGAETTWFCRMRLSSESGLIFTEVHPTFLYESLWNLVGFIILTAIFKKRKFDGQIFLMAVSWYGLGRFFIEDLRQDSLMIGSNIRISQVLAAVLFVSALGLLIYGFIKYKERHVLECIYATGTKKYDDFMAKTEEKTVAEDSSEAPLSDDENTENNESIEEAPAEEKAEEETAEITKAPEIAEENIEEVEEVEESTESTEKTDG